MDRIAFVCQRYGPEVNGGSELHCRQLAERLAAFYEVTVYTTCSLQYSTWENEYEPGAEEIGGVRVKRYPVAEPRDPERFDRISDKVFLPSGHTDLEEQEFVREQGPYCPALLEALEKEHGSYRAVFFMTYLYYLTAAGLPMGFPNAALIPTLHDEPSAHLRYYDAVFAAAKAIAWNTEEEKAFAEKRFPSVRNTPGIMVGVGVDGPGRELPALPAGLREGQYLVYAGRIDESKGCGEMFEFFRRYRAEHGGSLKLVLMGKPVMEVPEDPEIVSLGFVSEEMKFAVMRGAFALVLFSRYESLSMVVLESLLMGRPVLVTEKCAVLKGHCLRSGAGLYFDDYTDFAGGLEWLRNHPKEYERMRELGKKYVREHYSWDVIIGKYRKLITELFPA